MALIDAIAVELGRPLTDVEQAQVMLWQQDMAAQISARLPGLTDQQLIDRVMRAAIVARITGPGIGVTQTSVSVDDARVDRRFSAGSQQLLTDAMWAELGWVDNSSIRTIRPSWQTYEEWAALQGLAE